jgi:WD40 repeat protein
MILQGKGSTVYSVAFSAEGNLVACGSHEGTIEIWEVQTGTLLQALRSPRPYERMNITNVKGLSTEQKIILRGLGALEET